MARQFGTKHWYWCLRNIACSSALLAIASLGACKAKPNVPSGDTNRALDASSKYIVGLVDQAMMSAKGGGGKTAPCPYLKQTSDGGTLRWLESVDSWSIRSAELFGIPKALVVDLVTEKAGKGRVVTVRIVFRDEKCEGFEAAFLAVD